MVKQKRKGFILTLVIIFTIIAINCLFCNTLSFANLKYNKKYDNEITGLILNQRPYNYIKYGLGTIKDNGCGAVSLYNILYLDGKPEKFSKIVSELDTGLFAYGFLGSNPFKLVSKLRDYGYKVSVSLNEKEFKQKAIESKYNILVYFNLFKYIGHYQLFYNYHETTNKFDFINVTYSASLENYMNDEDVKSSLKFLITIN